MTAIADAIRSMLSAALDGASEFPLVPWGPRVIGEEEAGRLELGAIEADGEWRSC